MAIRSRPWSSQWRWHIDFLCVKTASDGPILTSTHTKGKASAHLLRYLMSKCAKAVQTMQWTKAFQILSSRSPFMQRCQGTVSFDFLLFEYAANLLGSSPIAAWHQTQPNIIQASQVGHFSAKCKPQTRLSISLMHMQSIWYAAYPLQLDTKFSKQGSIGY